MDGRMTKTAGCAPEWWAPKGETASKSEEAAS